MINQALNIFLLEDRKTDVELVKRAILKFIPSAIFTHAKNETEFLDKINWMQYDLVLADYNLPDYTGLDALLYIREKFPLLPFIFVTGTLDNEVEVAQTILRGANGYVLKNNLKELAVQVPAALIDATEKKKEELDRIKRDNLAKLKLQEAVELIQSSPDFSIRDQLLQLLKEAQQSNNQNVRSSLS